MRGFLFSLIIAGMVVLAADATSSEKDGEKSGPGGAPSITIDATEHDFGVVTGTHGLEHIFRVGNAGTRPLVITRVKTSCGCTAAMMETSVIDPGEEGKLRVSFNPGQRKGHARKTVTIHSNDPVRPALGISVSANVLPEAVAEAMEKSARKRAHEKLERLSFAGDCARCHVPESRSVRGRELYAGVCAGCHGAKGEGEKINGERIGPALQLNQMSVKSRGGIRQTISAGTGDPSMPGFVREYGGPLTGAQVDSLVDLIMAGIESESDGKGQGQ